MDYPVIFDKSKWMVLAVFAAVLLYGVFWFYLKPD